MLRRNRPLLVTTRAMVYALRVRSPQRLVPAKEHSFQEESYGRAASFSTKPDRPRYMRAVRNTCRIKSNGGMRSPYL
uniref:Secreted protein n=1 Tax=Steinernema glaseri TaxID=37863 RepID=A0A1I7YLB6_9BILA